MRVEKPVVSMNGAAEDDSAIGIDGKDVVNGTTLDSEAIGVQTGGDAVGYFAGGAVGGGVGD